MTRVRPRWAVAGFGAYLAIALGWLLLGLAAALIAAAPTLQIRAALSDIPLVRALAVPADPEPGAQLLLDYAFSTVNIAIGLYLFRLRHRAPAAGLLAVAMIGTAVAFNLTGHRTGDVVLAATGFDVDIWHLVLFHALAGVAYTNALVVFPDERPWRGTRFWPAAGLLAANAVLLLMAFATGTAPHVLAFLLFYGGLTPVIGIVAQAVRARRAPTPQQRQQSRVLMWAMILVTGAAIAFTALTALAGTVGAAGLTEEGAVVLTFRLCRALFTVIPLALVVGVLRLRLWDADRLISRALVYGVLVTLISGVYVGLVVFVSDWLGGGRRSQPGSWLLLVTAMTAAVLFGPARDRATRLANQLLYGQRATPYEVLAGLSRRLQAMPDPADPPGGGQALTRMAEVTAQGLGATTGRVRLLLPAGGHREARWPAGEPAHLAGGALDERTYRVHDRGEHVGDIVLSFHPGTVTAADRRLLEDLVRHAGPALRNLRLTEELRTRLADSTRRAAELRDSCARIVSAADTARYDLERDLHDGTQQLLIALRVQLSLFERQRFADPARALDLLRQVRSQITEAVRQLGDLGAGLYPPTLANEGLAAALTERSSRAGLTVHLEIPASLRQRRFPEQLESAVYFCCLEALQNAAKHARTPVTLRLATDAGALVFTVVDRGPGFDPDAGHTGAGLANMSDRTAAVGGELVVNAAPGAGVTITGRVPIPPGECWHLAGSGW